MSKQKWGTGHFGAMGRLGLAELRASMYTGSNVAQPSIYGLYGTKTPGEVADDRRDVHGNSKDPKKDKKKGEEKKGEEKEDQAKEGAEGNKDEPKKQSVIEDRLRQAEASVEQEKTKDKEPDRDRDSE